MLGSDILILVNMNKYNTLIQEVSEIEIKKKKTDRQNHVVHFRER